MDQSLAISRGAVFSALGMLLCALPAPAGKHCSIHPARYRGWSAQEIQNEWLTLTVVPQLGGRLMQVTFGPHDYLFVNKRYEGKYIPPLEPNAPPQWYNYGGDKIWPLPEGRGDQQHWPGPIADVLDDGDYAFSIVSQEPVCKIRLDGPADPRTGLQYSREIALQADSPQISFHAVMKNASSRSIEWSLQSVTQYSTADSSERKASADIWAFTAANDHSAYPGGFQIRSGDSSPPGLSIKNGLVALNYEFVEYELWFDTQDGWLAIADDASRYVMVERFRVQKGKEYPGHATVIFYTNGSEPPEADLYYMEAEINSPLVRLQPGEIYAMDTEWYPSRAGKDVIKVTEAGVVADRLRISGASGKQKLTGAFGVFFEGRIVAKFTDQGRKAISAKTLMAVTPRESARVDAEVLVPKGAKRAALYLIDSEGRERGLLDEVTVDPGGQGD